MCGIAGIFKFNQPVTLDDLNAVQRINDGQAHRGPDAVDVLALPVFDSVSVLGHRRLSIIDLSDAGKQPMSNVTENIWITYNGEVYNFQPLRNELLKLGYAFRSRTDTEVLIYGYEAWGIEGLLSRLRGMFAFALLDVSHKENPRLILARDRFGIKPLYYYQDRQRLIFASEVRALLKTGMLADESNAAALVGYLQYGSVPSPLTTVKDIYSLPAGHYLIAEASGCAMKKYWELADYLLQSTGPLDAKDAAAETLALLEESVEQHLISDVPLGVFLSGGIDSSALVALASQFRTEPLTTLSVVFDESEFSEAGYARLMAEKYHTDHREILLRSEEFYQELPRVFEAMDQPTVDGVNSYFVSRAAKQAGLTVVLAGTGGDEVFLGYPYHKRAYKNGMLLKALMGTPQGLRSALLAGASKLSAVLGQKDLGKLSYLANPTSEADIYLMFRGLFNREQIQTLLGISEAELKESGIPGWKGSAASKRPLIDVITEGEFKYFLQNQLLKDTDFMGMAFSLEARVPFLDHKLVEYILGVPVQEKFADQMSKPLLVKALGKRLPEAIWNRPKMGFTFPFGIWMKSLANELREKIYQKGLFERRAVDAIWQGFEAGQLHWSRAWALVAMSSCQSNLANLIA
jgi:asparagine synthase (glutamine-hydrolysing)